MRVHPPPLPRNAKEVRGEGVKCLSSAREVFVGLATLRGRSDLLS